MLDVGASLDALAAIVVLAVITWTASVRKADVSIVDSVWAMLFLLGAIVYAVAAPIDVLTARALVALALLSLWALRLCAYITWRNWGHGEDRRYRVIRARNEPGFAWKSLYLVFGLQATLAWLIVIPVLSAVSSTNSLRIIDAIGVAVWALGFAFESIGDAQLARFIADPSHHDRVLDSGLWRYTRHPNYFGETTQWWGMYMLAVGAGAWWTIFAPLIITFMLLKVSGVVLLEKDIGERRPAYRDYAARTSAFVPWPPRPRIVP